MNARTSPTAHVVGSINRDIVAYASHLPRPGETVLGSRGAVFPGGKGANQAVAVARLGGACCMIGRVGADGFGTEMRAFLVAQGVDASGIETVADCSTGFALITIDDHAENCITVVPGANAIWPAGIPTLTLAATDIVVAQLEVPLPIVQGAFVQARRAKARTVLNPAPFQSLPDELLALTDILVLNETELAALAGHSDPIDPSDTAALAGHVAPLFARGLTLVIVTLGRHGACVHARTGTPARIGGRGVAARDSTGAGDCFVGALVSRLLAGDEPVSAAGYANAAAALSVTREGAAASFPTAAEMAAFVAAAS